MLKIDIDNLGESLRTIREERGQSRQSISNELGWEKGTGKGLHQNSIERIESGGNIYFSNLIKLVNALGYSMALIKDGDEIQKEEGTLGTIQEIADKEGFETIFIRK